MSRWYFLALLLVLVPICVSAQSLSDQEFEARVKKGIDHIYNLEFEKGEYEFTDLVRARPKDPAGHFFLAMVDWWRILIDIDNRRYDDQFLDSLDVVVDLCDEMLDRNENDVTAMFFKGGAIGFQGRLKFHRNDYLGAASAGKRALPLVQDASSADPKNYDIFLGTGIYNYYAEVIPDQYPWTKPLLLFLPSGDKQKGIQQLTMCSEKGKYASVECTYFLLQIYYSYERDFQKALVLALSLNSRFPDNPLFHRYLGRCYVSTTNWQMVQNIFGEVAARAEKKQRGYSASTLREAEYYLGLCTMNNKQYDVALKHLYKCDELSRSLDKDEVSGFMVMSNLKLGMAYDALSRRELAEKQYRKVLDMKEYLDSHKQAEDYLRIPFTMR
jgi:tetratricopeptide (TPR) repeat protein